MNKAYIINLKFNTWENQLWFSGEDSEKGEENWKKAQETLDAVGDECTSSNEFFIKAVEHFENLGFMRIQK